MNNLETLVKESPKNYFPITELNVHIKGVKTNLLPLSIVELKTFKARYIKWIAGNKVEISKLYEQIESIKADDLKAKAEINKQIDKLQHNNQTLSLYLDRVDYSIWYKCINQLDIHHRKDSVEILNKIILDDSETFTKFVSEVLKKLSKEEVVQFIDPILVHHGIKQVPVSKSKTKKVNEVSQN